ncbi:VOC family protein [Tellurirhabdus rosea]|uniref:VOC family protein n=1 Tax=Tellurirhabdus rosea TaxID=2674997 RepID=UPI002259E1F8|nr:VOC family protein [Tellurirhabdus rosea]
MATKIFVNLPVKDLNRSIEFFTKLGFQFNQQFTDEKATCMVITEDIYAMLLVERFFQGFTKIEVTDTSKSREVIVALSADSREAVDELADKALAAGAAFANEPMDQDFMYGRSFIDPDGHMWEVFFMDPSVIEHGQGQAVSEEAGA